MSYIRRRDQVQQAAENWLPPIDPDFAQKYPAVFEYMTAINDPDGRPRRTATLTISAEEGVWKACLNDRETGYQLFVTSPLSETIFERLEAILASPEPHWRRNPWADKQVRDNKGRK